MKLGKEYSTMEFDGKTLVILSPQESKAGASISSYRDDLILYLNKAAINWYSLQEHNTFILGLNNEQEDENLYLIYAPNEENIFVLRGNNFILPKEADYRMRCRKFSIEESEYNGLPMLILKPKPEIYECN